MTPQIQSNVREFSAAFREYIKVTSLTPADAVLKQAQEFSLALRGRLRQIAPIKGAVRAERLAALQAGEGVKVRQAVLRRLMERRGVSQRIKGRGYVMGKNLRTTAKVSGKRLNFTALAVRAELNLREQGRGFVAHSTNFRQLAKIRAERGTQRQQVLDRYRRFLSSVGVTVNPTNPRAVFSWGGNQSSGDVAKVLSQGRGQESVAGALADARNNMMVYVRRKLAENAAKTVGRVR